MLRLKLACFGLPLAPYLLLRDGYDVRLSVLSPVDAPGRRRVLRALGPERVLYAMDYPYQQSSDDVAAYDRMELRPEHKRMLMQTNAERVFGFSAG